jgi:hypothetical protein
VDATDIPANDHAHATRPVVTALCDATIVTALMSARR